MKTPNFVSRLHDLIMSEDLDIKHKLQNMLLAISIIGSSVSVIIAVILHDKIANIILSVFCLLMQILAFYVSAVKRKKTAGMMIVFIAINLIIFPLMFYGNGGVFSGMPIWFAFGLIYPWLVSEGAVCVVMFLLNALMALICFGTQYYFPELFVVPTDADITSWVIIDIIKVLFLVAIIL